MLLINYLLKKYYAIVCGINYTKIKYNIADEKYELSLKQLKELNQCCKKNYTYFIFMALCLKKVKNDDTQVIDFFYMALEDIKQNTKRNVDEKNYISIYIYLWLKDIYTNSNNYKKIEECEKKIDSLSYNINNVKDYIKYDFPVS